MPQAPQFLSSVSMSTHTGSLYEKGPGQKPSWGTEQ
jgi:hypothetical protein